MERTNDSGTGTGGAHMGPMAWGNSSLSIHSYDRIFLPPEVPEQIHSADLCQRAEPFRSVALCISYLTPF